MLNEAYDVRKRVVSDVEAHIDSGDLVIGYDLAMGAILAGRGGDRLRYLAVLALARMGATEEAIAHFEDLQIGSMEGVDAAALRARLMKDQALADWPRFDSVSLIRAADAYTSVFESTGDPFPGANAATLYRLAGERETGCALAARLLGHPSQQECETYWDYATRIECLIVLDRMDDAARICPDALAARDFGRGKLASTLRQFTYLLSTVSLDDATRLRGLLTNGSSAFFHFHEKEASGGALPLAGISELVGAKGIQWAFGRVSNPAELEMAEGLLDAGVSVCAVLPADPDSCQEFLFSDQHLRARFRDLLGRVSIHPAGAGGSFSASSASLRFAEEIALGRAILKATEMSATAVALNIDASGTLFAEIVGDTTATQSNEEEFMIDRSDVNMINGSRVLLSYLFSDFTGYGSLTEHEIPIFWEKVLGAAAIAIDQCADHLIYKNTWGDACFAAFDTATGAANAAVLLKKNLDALGVLGGHTMRLSLHRGTAFTAFDPVINRLTPLGSAVSRGARIESIALPGQIFASEAFVAALLAEGGTPWRLDYLGRKLLAKGAGEERLFRLRTIA